MVAIELRDAIVAVTNEELVESDNKLEVDEYSPLPDTVIGSAVVAFSETSKVELLVNTGTVVE